MGRLYHDAKKTAENFGDPASAAFLAGDEYLAKPSMRLQRHLVSEGFKPYWTSLPGQVASQAGLAAPLWVRSALSFSSRWRTHVSSSRSSATTRMNLGIPKTGEFDLAEFIGKAYGVGDFENIWTVEGLGHVYSQRTWILQHNVSEMHRAF